MSELAPALGQLALVVGLAALVAGVYLRWLGIPVRLGRFVFYFGTLGLPLSILAAGTANQLPPQIVVFTAMLGALTILVSFLLIGVRPGPRTEDNLRRLRLDTGIYLLANVFWFALIYWSGSSSAIEGLHFEVAPAVIGQLQPGCALAPMIICNHLTFWEALHYSAGNLLTLGAAGIVPLDEVTRVLTTVQLVPVFVAGYVLVRT
jgi:hypothetical protein